MPSGQPVDWINVALRTAARAGVEVAAIQLHSRFATHLEELRDHEMGYVCVLTFRSTNANEATRADCSFNSECERSQNVIR